MLTPIQLHLRLLVVTGCVLLAAGPVAGCSVPVFRYALEHWNADPYEAVVFHRGPLSAHNAALLRSMDGKGGSSAAAANINVRDVDLAQSPSSDMLEFWKEAGSPDAPWLVLRAPHPLQPTGHVFSAPLADETVNSVLDSPLRREITSRIGEGESAVWLLLESGNKTHDDAAAKLLETRLQYLATVLELPKLDEQDIKNGLLSLPDDGLHLAFSLLRVSRNDPAERAFVATLLATEKDLKEQTGPIVFPIFGQARALYALVGAGIKHENIDRAASFLIGSCSCQVKEQNPGADLLMTVNWKKLLKDQSLGVQDLPKTSDIIGSLPEAVTISPHAATEDAGSAECGVVMGWMRTHRGLVATGSVLLLASLVGWLRFRKRGT